MDDDEYHVGILDRDRGYYCRSFIHSDAHGRLVRSRPGGGPSRGSGSDSGPLTNIGFIVGDKP